MTARLFSRTAVRLVLFCLVALAVQGARSGVLWASTDVPASLPVPVASAPTRVPEPTSSVPQQTLLLWPKDLAQFQHEYASWPLWLDGADPAPEAVHDELLVSVRALAALIPDLHVSDEPGSGSINVSGSPAALGALRERLRDHPLLARITEDTCPQCHTLVPEPATAPTREFAPSPAFPRTALNVRNHWVTNVVWGYVAPGATVDVTLTRPGGQVLTATVSADAEGLYHAYLRWEIREGDQVEMRDGVRVRRIAVGALQASVDRSTGEMQGSALTPKTERAAAGVPRIVQWVVGPDSAEAVVDPAGAFGAHLGQSPRRGTPGFLYYWDDEDNRVYSALRVPVVYVRRDTSYGLPYGSAHGDGISTIVWGYAAPRATLAFTLTRSGSVVVTRTATADQTGYYAVSMDRFIEDGDQVQASAGMESSIVPVPIISATVDPETKLISGTAPAEIAAIGLGAPHSLQLHLAGRAYSITTTVTGAFSLTLNANPYVAGLLGALCYTTPEGNQIYKPLFVADPLVRGKTGDWRADVILGQPDFSQITPKEVVGNKAFLPGGVYVDRSVRPNRVYVYDSGNSRVLGLSHLGVCQGGTRAGQPCTANCDCPDSSCQIQSTRSADIVLGQPSFNTSACNGDSGYQTFPDVALASGVTLCGMREEQTSISEGGSGATLASDTQGNLYVPDHFNNRILRYNDPFATDATADYVWGQADFSGTTCNRGASYGRPDRSSLCLAPPPGMSDLLAGVAVDSAGNLWVADTNNNRVLRFPFDAGLGVPAPRADLVLGQLDFVETAAGTGLNRMHKPASVRVTSDGVVFVADSLNHRVLVFDPPLLDGMKAQRSLGEDLLNRPLGLEIGEHGELWVNDGDNRRLIMWQNGILRTNLFFPTGGGMGVDCDGNALGGSYETQDVLRPSPPTYAPESVLLRADPEAPGNQTGSRGMDYGMGLEIAAGQLIYADGSRMLFWNNPWDLKAYQPADGLVGEPDYQTRHRWQPGFLRMRADQQGRLWVIQGSLDAAAVLAYQLPLQTAATPVFTLTSPLPLQGGGVFTWTWALQLSGIDYQASCDGLWLSDRDNNRVFRIRDVSIQPTVDIVLGQRDASEVRCNQGRDPEDLYARPMSPTQDSLCHPGALAFDRQGNLFVADHNLEVAGNWRLLEFDAAVFPNAPTTAVFGIPATRVYGRDGDFTEPAPAIYDDPMNGPWEPAFDSRGQMAIGFNGYLGSRFPMVYQNPLTNPLPVAVLGDFQSMPLSARFDQFDNLYILDHNRNRVLIYRQSDVRTFTLTGTIRTPNGVPIPGVTLQTVGYASSSISSSSGAYTLTGLVTGTYQITPSRQDYVFTPITRGVIVPGVTTGLDFTGYEIPAAVTITLPHAGASIGGLVTVTVEGRGSRAELYLDGVQHARATAVPAQWSWSTQQVVNGTHILRAVAYNSLGHPAASTPVTVTVSNAAPATHWAQVGLGGLTVIDLAVALGEQQVVYAATQFGDVYRSQDAGMFWTLTTRGLPVGASLSSLAISPRDSRVVYVGSQGYGVYKTTDGGDTWVSTGLRASVQDLAVAPSDEDRLYAVGWGAYRSTDAGNSWSVVMPDVPLWSVAIGSGDAQTAFVGGDWGTPAARIYKSTDGGTSWISRTVGSPSGGIYAITVDPVDPRVVYAGKQWGEGGVYKSADGGLTWVNALAPAGLNTTCLALAPNDPRVLYVGNGWGGLFRGNNGTAGWTSLSEGLPAGVGVYAAAADPANAYTVYAGLGGSGVWKYTTAVPPAMLTVSGPSGGITGVRHTFSAVVSPVTTTTPLTYTWSATGLSAQTHTGGGLSDSVSFTWPTAGTKTVGVTARNVAGAVVSARNIVITLAAWAPATRWSTGFAPTTGWSSQDAFPRALADVNGDSKADVIGFGAAGTYVSLSPGTGLGAMTRWSTGFGSSVAAGSWVSQTIYPRMLGDVNGDGKADVVGFGGAGVYVALARPTGVGTAATSFGPMAKWSSSFGFLPAAGSWTTQEIYPRALGDVNGDGKADIVGFGAAGVYVALATPVGVGIPATTFGPMRLWSPSFGSLPGAGGWANQNTYPRLLADVNADGKADIVGFGAAGAYVALSTGTAFAPMPPTPWIRAFGASPAGGGWISQDLYPRTLADVNADGKADIVGYGAAGAYYSLSTGSSFSAMTFGSGQFGANPAAGGWSSQNTYPRFAADLNHDHKADLVGFGAAGVYVGLHN